MKYALFSFCAWIVGAQGPAGNLYVATNGNDAWSGRLAGPNTAATDGPVRTIAVVHATASARGAGRRSRPPS